MRPPPFFKKKTFQGGLHVLLFCFVYFDVIGFIMLENMLFRFILYFVIKLITAHFILAKTAKCTLFFSSSLFCIN